MKTETGLHAIAACPPRIPRGFAPAWMEIPPNNVLRPQIFKYVAISLRAKRRPRGAVCRAGRLSHSMARRTGPFSGRTFIGHWPALLVGLRGVLQHLGHAGRSTQHENSGSTLNVIPQRPFNAVRYRNATLIHYDPTNFRRARNAHRAAMRLLRR